MENQTLEPQNVSTTLDDELSGEANYDAAVEKIKAEMNANTNQPYVQAVGAYLLQHLEANVRHSTKILAEDKTILKSLDVMSRFAEQKRVGRCAVLTDEEGFSVVLNYFGCWEGEPFELPPEPPKYVPPVRTHNPVQTTSKSRSNKTSQMPEQISLFDL